MQVFDVTESPGDEFNVSLDFTEVTVDPATLIIPGAVTPAQTAEGSAVWDTDGDFLTIGDGASRQTFLPVIDATSDPLAVSTAAADGTEASTARKDHVHVGAPIGADYLVGSAQAGLSAEIVVGTAPGGELGGTWAAPTVAATHSGSVHHAILTLGDTLHTLVAQALSGVAASLTQVGHVELATSAEIDTGTDTTRAMPVDQFVASARNVRYILFRVLAAATAHTVSTTVGGDLELPFTGTITEIGAFVDTAGTTNLATIDVNLGGTTLMTTNKITIDSTEKTSRTAATAPALTTTAVTAGDIITVDIDAIQTTAAKGLTVRLGIRMT